MAEYALLPLWFKLMIGASAGLIVGSYLATIFVRWPKGRSAMAGRSHCDSCGRTLTIGELIPLLSYLLQRGKCRTCGAAVGKEHLAIEIMGGCLGAVAFALAPNAGTAIAGALLGWQLLLLAALDARHMWLPDRLTAGLALSGLAASILLGQLPIIDAMIGAAAGFLILWLVALSYRLWRGREGLGGGDPKLFGAIGCWVGWQSLPLVLLLGAGAGLLAVAIARLQGRKIVAETALPFGTLLAAATFPIWLSLMR